MIALIISYPRSGSHFLSYSIMSKYDADIRIKHPGFMDFDPRIIRVPTIGLIRNPLECIASIISLQEKRFGVFPEEELEKRIINEKEAYMHSLDFIDRRVPIIIDNSSLKNIDQVVDLIAKKHNMNYANKTLQQEEFYQNVPVWKKESSKNHSRYEYIKEMVYQDDLVEQNNLYLDLLGKVEKLSDAVEN